MDETTEITINTVALFISIVAVIFSIVALRTAYKSYSTTKSRIIREEKEYISSLEDQMPDN